jgi:hypothetical protein
MARMTSFGTGGGGGFIRPATRTVAVAPRQVIATAPLSRPATSIPYYDPARVIDPSRLRLVADVRDPAARLFSEQQRADEFADERGDVQTGDNGILGPGGIAPPSLAPGIAPTGTQALTPANLGLLAVAAFLLFGG